MSNGKTAIITGGSRGIGRAIALKLAQEGYNVAIIFSGNEAAALETVKLAQVYDVSAKSYKCNVENFSDTKELIAQVLADFKRIDVLVNNAGITKDNLILGLKEEDFDKVIDVNLKGVFNMVKHITPIFMKQRQGRIINLTSISGIVGNAGQINYSASKAGVIGMTKTIAKELASRNITCNAVAPGFIDTDMTAVLGEDMLNKAAESIPLKRRGKPEDVANLVAFLAGDEASYITGEIIKVDGGLAI